MTHSPDAKRDQHVSGPQLERALEQLIEGQRTRLLQAHAVLTCLYEVLLHTDGEDAVAHAEATRLAAKLIDESAERLDVQRLRPLMNAARVEQARRVPPEQDFGATHADQVRDSAHAPYVH